VRKAVVGRANRPQKSRRKRSDGDEDERGASIRKHLLRLWRKLAWKIFEDGRDPPPSFDSEWWQRHRQRTADPIIRADHEQGRGLRHDRPDCPSPTP
jgi:hypothetical protein